MCAVLSILLSTKMHLSAETHKRKDKKKGAQVPLSELGFRAKVYYGIESEMTRTKGRQRTVKYILHQIGITLTIVRNASWDDFRSSSTRSHFPASSYNLSPASRAPARSNGSTSKR